MEKKQVAKLKRRQLDEQTNMKQKSTFVGYNLFFSHKQAKPIFIHTRISTKEDLKQTKGGSKQRERKC